MKKILIGVSVFMNVIVIALAAFSFARTSAEASLSFLDLRTENKGYTTAACVISVPSAGAGVVFGPAEFSLGVNEEASLQFSLVVDKNQMNLALEALYDHAVISAEPSGYGLVIKGIKPGETVVQLFSGNGIRDIAYITIHE